MGRRFVRYIIWICWLFPTVAAAENRPVAWSVRYGLPPVKTCVHLAAPEEEIAQILRQENTRQKMWTYAAGISADIRPASHGQWDTLPLRNGYVWRTAIHADNALSLNLLLESFRLNDGESLYVYNEEQSVIYAFDKRDNRDNRLLPVESIRGNTVIVEWDVPAREAAIPFMISNVGYGFREARTGGSIIPLAAGECNVDINCPEGNRWQREKRSGVRMQVSYPDKSGVRHTRLCTGVLVNQVGEIKKPYILTACHCVSTEEMAAGTTVRFEYENETCGTSSTSPVQKTIAGATLLASKRDLDFALIELLSDIPENFHPYYAGWNLSPDAPVSAVSIHHPQGDVKKISTDKDALSTSTYQDNELKCMANAHWLIGRWDVGVTENGSSGSPLFDPEHLLVGTLTGGDAQCSKWEERNGKLIEINKPEKDYYSKFSYQWNTYEADSLSLQSWLDRNNTGVKKLYGYDPAAPFEMPCDTLSHIGRNEAKMLTTSGQWGALTGHSDKTRTAFAERFTNDSIAQIIGIEANIAKVFSNGSQVRFSIWTGNEYPVTEVWGKNITIAKQYRNTSLQIDIDGTLTVTGDFFVGFGINYIPVDTFAVYHSTWRMYEGISALYVQENGGIWKPLSDEVPPAYISLAMRAIGKFGKEKPEPDNNKSPARELEIVQTGNGNIYTNVENHSGSVVVECFDVSGKRMQVHEINRHFVILDAKTYLQIHLNISGLPYGMYILRVKDSNKIHTGKFIKQ
ncbi:MAG: trypsin-like peptidase domain-containing protein [Bacteroidales bacterium]|jgi:hypothetical protein|nr:trypsin-like peptidase domain-containing protein [Bacteroidales bacterium]